jgi:plasmid replication initiation protein
MATHTTKDLLKSGAFDFIKKRAEEAEQKKKVVVLERVKSRPVQETDSVVESNALARAEYRMTLIEKRLMNLAVAKLDSSLADADQLQDIPITAEEYMRIYEVSGKNAYAEMAQAAKRLMNRQLTIRHEGKSYTIYNLLVESNYREREGVVVITLNPRLASQLIGLRNRFTQFVLESVRHFRLFSSARIYEMMKSVESQGVFELSIEDFKARVLADPKKYKKFYDLKRWVLEPALAEINTLSDIRVEFEPVRESRKIKRIRF